MEGADPAYRHMVRHDGRVTRCGRRPPRDDSNPETLDMCPECIPGPDLPDSAKRAHAHLPPHLSLVT